MAKHSYERARWNRREARRRVSMGGWWVGYGCWTSRHDPEEDWKSRVLGTRKRLNQTIHRRMSEASRKYRRLWRRQAHEIGRLHLLGAHDEAETLDPLPRKLGVMWDIW